MGWRMLLGASLVLAQSQETVDWPGRIARTAFPITQAVDRALEEAGSGTPYHAELEQDGEDLVYSVDLWQEKTGVNVVLDAVTGKVLEREEEPEDVSAAVGACKVGLQQAIRAALESRKSAVVEAELLAGAEPRYRIRCLGDRDLETLEVSAVTGRVQGSAGKADPPPSPDPEFQSTFEVERSDLGPRGRNPFMILEPGWELVLEGKEGRHEVHLVISVLEDTRTVDGVECAVVEEREAQDGALVEVSRNFFAISGRSNAVYYFGEEVDIYRDGKVSAHEGAWQSGQDGAVFGLFLPGTPVLGSRYYNEHAPGVALDRVEIVSVDTVAENPAGRFEGCLRARETTPLEPRSSEFKLYARGVGCVQDGPLTLVRYGKKSGAR